MTVKELIEELNKCNPDAVVVDYLGKNIESLIEFKEYDSDDGYSPPTVILDDAS